MKKLSLITVASVMVFVLGCGSEQPLPPPSAAEPILKGEHKLHKMTERTDGNANTAAAFFLFVGDSSGKSGTQMLIKFAWEMNDSTNENTYAFSTLPLEKIRVKVDETAATPTVKFRWRPWRGGGSPEVLDLMNGNVLYAVLTVKESDWPIQIVLPRNVQ